MQQPNDEELHQGEATPLLQEVLPVWRRHVDSVKGQSEDAISQLLQGFSALLQQFEQAPQEMFAAGRSGLPAIPSLPTNSSRGAHFDSVELIDPTAPSAVLRYGEPLGHGVGQAFQFLQIAVPIPTSDAS